MEKTHRKTRGSKSHSNEIVIPADYESAWAAARKELGESNADELRKEGWRSISDVSEETGAPARTLHSRMNDSRKFEKQKHRIRTDLGIREVSFFRPKISLAKSA